MASPASPIPSVNGTSSGIPGAISTGNGTGTGTGTGTGSSISSGGVVAPPPTSSSVVLVPSVSNVPITSTSVSLVTSFSTLTLTSSNTVQTSIVSSVSSVNVITVSQSPSTVFVTPTFSPSVTAITSIITATPTVNGTPQPPQVVTITSTYSNPAPSSTSSAHPSTSSRPSELTADSSSASGGSSGLSSGATIAIAVVIPVFVIAAAFMIGLFLWRRRRDQKSEAELRKNEMAEYGFNPNSDPNLAPIAAGYVDNKSEGDSDGYRGWGQTSTRKASTTLGSGGLPGAGLSDTTSQPGGYAYQTSPTGTGHASIDPLIHNQSDGIAAGAAAAAAMGGAAAIGAGVARHKSQNAGGLRRGPSNASSTYSVTPMSEASSDAHTSPGTFYQEEVPYNIYTDTQSQYGPYTTSNPYVTNNNNQPVIRDVQARRNTRIERAPTFPQNQGGISQNF